MILHRLARITRGQQGFTLLELIVAVALTALIGVGATTATVQVMTQTNRNTDYTAASRHVMNAIYWLSRDAQMSQTVLTDNGTTGFPLTLGWTEWDNSAHQVVYSVVDDMFRRSYSVDGGLPSETMVAEYINSVAENTTCEFSGGVLTVKVTATIGAGSNAHSVTKTREITPRPGL